MRIKSILQQNTSSLKYLLLLLFVPLFMFMLYSCEKEGEEEEEIEQKEIIASVSADVAMAGVDVLTFTDETPGVESRTWTFPGGDPATSRAPEVEVVFNETGDIVVTLEVVFSGGSKATKEFPITVVSELIADFSASATEIAVRESVTFTDESTGEPTSWSWVFEGGTPATSTEQNPTVTFNENIAADVTLTITRESDGATHSVTKNDFIQVGSVEYPELTINGDFETGTKTPWQSWAGGGGGTFPLDVIEGGANGTNYTASFNYKASWGGAKAEVFSRDKAPSQKIALENGRDYNISVYVKADQADVVALNFFIRNELPTWSSSFEEGVDTPEPPTTYLPTDWVPGETANSPNSTSTWLTTEWQKVEKVVHIPNDGLTRSNAYPCLWFFSKASSDVTVYLDEISMKIAN